MMLAPMSDVTDEAFRRMLLKLGRPDIFWTEFVSADGLVSKGKEKILEDLRFFPAEHPIVVQVFGANPGPFKGAAEIIRNLGFDGIDINMGCPNKDVVKMGAGAALIKNPNLAKQIIKAVKQGAGGEFPVSVKTRIGYSKNEVDKWIPALLEENLAALTVHFRTKNEMFKVPAHWELAKKIVRIRDRYAQETLIFGNGDVKSLSQACQLAKKTGLDGIMIGRGVLANPWFFSGRTPDLSERLDAVIEHVKIFEKLHKNNFLKNGSIKNFDIMKKYFKAYATGFDGAKDLRERLMGAKNANEVKQIIKKFLRSPFYRTGEML